MAGGRGRHGERLGLRAAPGCVSFGGAKASGGRRERTLVPHDAREKETDRQELLDRRLLLSHLLLSGGQGSATLGPRVMA